MDKPFLVLLLFLLTKSQLSVSETSTSPSTSLITSSSDITEFQESTLTSGLELPATAVLLPDNTAAGILAGTISGGLIVMIVAGVFLYIQFKNIRLNKQSKSNDSENLQDFSSLGNDRRAMNESFMNPSYQVGNDRGAVNESYVNPSYQITKQHEDNFGDQDESVYINAPALKSPHPENEANEVDVYEVVDQISNLAGRSGL